MENHEETYVRSGAEDGVKQLITHQSQEVVGIMSYGLPREDEDHWRFSGELYDFSLEQSLSGEQALAIIKTIVDHYREAMTPPPADFFISREEMWKIQKVMNLPLEEIASAMNLTSTPDEKFMWQDANRTYYTYKITSRDSEKYYIGVSHVKTANATLEDCLNDGYMGSGGTSKKNKFNNWKKRHNNTLRKEILGIHKNRMSAFKDERDLIGDSWRDDPLCLNSRAGGETRPPHGETWEKKNCTEHGEAFHQGDKCASCAREKAVKSGHCEKHGESTFRGSKCERCIGESAIQENHCEIHGLVTFQGNKCSSCTTGAIVSEGYCEKHGLTAFRGEHCAKCVKLASQSLRKCPKHGLTKFTGDHCYTCTVQGSYSIDTCEKHGEVKFHGGKCILCRPSNVTLKECPTHGLSKHRGSSCYKCAAARRKPLKNN